MILLIGVQSSLIMISAHILWVFVVGLHIFNA
jgi:hypothetical protein